jgi:hypothetical protein
MKGRSRKTDCPLVLAACHKLDQGDRIRNLHEFNKSVSVGEKTTVFVVCMSSARVLVWVKGRAKQKRSLILCIWTDKEQVLFILNLPQIVPSTKPLSVWHTFPRT